MADNYVTVNSAPAGDTKMQTYLNTIAASDVHAEAVVLVDSSGAPITTLPVSGPLTDAQMRAVAVPVSGTFFQATQPISGTVNVGNFPATQPVSGTVNIGNFPVTQPISGSVNIGNFPAIQPVSQSGDWTVKSPNASNFLSSVSGTVTAISANASNFLATVSGTVGITANSTVDVQKVLGTTIDVNSGTKSAGTQRVVLATDQPQLTNKLLVTPDVNSSFNLSQVLGTTVAVNSGTLTAGTQRVVLATDQPALTNKLLVTPDSNVAVDLARIQGQASVASVAGVLDVMPRKRTGATGLSPTYVSGKINTSTTTQIVQSTVYLSSLQLSVYAPGTTWAVNVTDRQTGSAGPLPIIPNFVVTSLVGANNPMTLSYAEPIICTSGINVITVGGTAGNIAYFATYWS